MASAAAAFQDDLGWATGGAFPSDAAGGLAAPSTGGKVLASDDFLDDFDADFDDGTGRRSDPRAKSITMCPPARHS